MVLPFLLLLQLSRTDIAPDDGVDGDGHYYPQLGSTTALGLLHLANHPSKRV